MKKFYNFGPQTTELIRKYLSSIQIFEKIIDKNSFIITFRYDFFMTGYSLSYFNILESHIAQFQKAFLLF